MEVIRALLTSRALSVNVDAKIIFIENQDATVACFELPECIYLNLIYFKHSQLLFFHFHCTNELQF
ncbi:hypothetical protein T4D_8756 [Trichinella pseudospiralis]|uniref:Uncharacterized protein n=1 Tax=Trichinella pseudospiralis TaxID=6337 RepID=A0A0V1FVW3_TRIPS|nr:hypothetical protein T4D_8756 [Trichinella pseudospiralis]